MAEAKRQPAIGVNTIVEVNGVPYHVQTEDVDAKKVIRTSVLVDECRVAHQEEHDYSKHLAKPNFASNLNVVLRACHERVVKRVRSGEISMSEIPSTPRPKSPDEVEVVIRPMVKSTSVSGTRQRTPSEIWNDLVKEASRRGPTRVHSSRPPPNWDQIVLNLKVS